MYLRSLRLNAFRAHRSSTLELTPGVNLLYGPNGAGKTNVLEAIHYLCLTKSFLTSQDHNVLQRDAAHFEVEGEFQGERRPQLKVRLAYAPGEGKKLFLNRAPLDRLSDIVGLLPVVTLSPDDYVLSAGGPEERRRYLDNTLSQAKPAYLHDLLRYRRALKQRNALLLYARQRTSIDPVALDAWTAELVELGARIIYRRHRFILEFSQYLEQAYGRIQAVGEEPSLTYDSAVELSPEISEDAIRDGFAARLARVASRERDRGRTLAGPHRDEVVFRLNDFEVRPYASQGQHRTFVLALKLASFLFLKEELDETPILLLDDVFGILDPDRSRIVLSMLTEEAVGQSIITAARREPFDDVVDWDDFAHQTLHVESGGVGAEAAAGA